VLDSPQRGGVAQLNPVPGVDSERDGSYVRELKKRSFKVKRALISLLVGTGMLVAPVATYAASTPLAPGGAAGIHKAESLGGVPIYAWVGGVLVVVGIVAITSNNGGSHIGTTTTCSPADPTGCSSGTGGTTGTTGTSGTT
jgi:hypothetical protein